MTPLELIGAVAIGITCATVVAPSAKAARRLVYRLLFVDVQCEHGAELHNGDIIRHCGRWHLEPRWRRRNRCEYHR